MMFKAIADNTNPASLAARLRGRRLAFFTARLARLEGSIRILDIGGPEKFWQSAIWEAGRDVRITLLNLSEQPVSAPNFTSVVGDARSLQFPDASFDIAFSNSVIEHVGDFANQRKMAGEVMRVGKRYFVQTPNRYFPVEPHFLFPFFQFLPLGLRAGLLRRFRLGWFEREPDPKRAREIVEEIRLLDKREMLTLFPGSCLFEEKFLWMTKSVTAYGGWE
jgi:SAM-dependent methyltransferase